ncbi:MAG: triose-phosphate isomerase [Bacillales bacterium]|jgi:triosephosphate isomerase|nr:triose-phosphate isomerase [Bacillales bacterium]
MRRKIVVGNWKMNKTNEETKVFVKEFEGIAKSLLERKIIVGIAPTYLSLATAVKGSKKLLIASQNVHFKENGAYTGEVSVPMLKELKVKWVIVGHSERRQYFNETNETCNLKLKALVTGGLNPIYCVGETLKEFEDGLTKEVIKNQLVEGLKDIEASAVKSFVIAYEPVWSIGTGKNASKEIAEDICAYIRSIIRKLYSKAISERVLIQYGGSVKPENVKEYLGQTNIDGALVGGASLKVDSFKTLLENI